MSKEKLFYFLVLPGTLLLTVTVIFVSVVTANQLKHRNYIGMDLEKERTVNVSGEGKVFGEPNIATVAFSVLNEAGNADDAMEENKKKMNEVISFLKNQEIDEKDLKTTSVNVSPRYEYHSRTEDFLPGERVLVAYQARQSLEVKIRDLEKVGVILEGAVNAGANQTSGLMFSIDDKEELKSEARKIAIKNAQEKADKLADKLGVKLEKIISYNESDRLPFLVRESMMAMDMKEMDGSPEMEIEPGQNEIKVNVNIGYEIQY